MFVVVIIEVCVFLIYFSMRVFVDTLLEAIAGAGDGDGAGAGAILQATMVLVERKAERIMLVP